MLPACIAAVSAATLYSIAVHSAAHGVFERDGWPGEGIPAFSARSKTLPIYERPDHSAKKRLIATIPHERIKYDKSTVITRRAADAIATAPINEVWCESLGKSRPEPSPLTISANEQFKYLQYYAEGRAFIRYRGEICEAFLSTQPLRFRLTGNREPVVEWWIRIVDQSDKPIGWLRASEKNLVYLPREF